MAKMILPLLRQASQRAPYCAFFHNSSALSQKADCYISKLTDPFTNLAIEEWLLRDTDPEKRILYLWRNQACIVIGRNQNPFKECNLRFMREHGIPLVRRRSGGGTVYHDMGNSNYTVFIPRASFSRKSNAELVTRALLELDIPAYVTERHDIAVDGHKISGSAYKIISKRAYHHGTMLIDTDVELLRGALSVAGTGKDKMVSKGVESVRSKVANLRDYSYTIDHQFFCEAVLEQFANEYNDGREIQPTIIDDASARDLPLRAVQVRDELRTWDWIYGQTPEFENKIEHEFMWGRVTARIKAEQGIITDVTLTTTRPEAATAVTVMAVALKGCKYDHGSVDEVIVKIRAEMPALLDREGGTISDVIAWLKEVVGM